jgi:hypothetical protein
MIGDVKACGEKGSGWTELFGVDDKWRSASESVSVVVVRWLALANTGFTGDVEAAERHHRSGKGRSRSAAVKKGAAGQGQAPSGRVAEAELGPKEIRRSWNWSSHRQLARLMSSTAAGSSRYPGPACAPVQIWPDTSHVLFKSSHPSPARPHPPLPCYLPLRLSLPSTRHRSLQYLRSICLNPSPSPVRPHNLQRARSFLHLSLLVRLCLPSVDVRTRPQTSTRPLQRKQVPFVLREGTRTAPRRRKLRGRASAARKPT